MAHSQCPSCGEPGPEGLICDRPRCGEVRYARVGIDETPARNHERTRVGLRDDERHWSDASQWSEGPVTAPSPEPRRRVGRMLALSLLAGGAATAIVAVAIVATREPEPVVTAMSGTDVQPGPVASEAKPIAVPPMRPSTPETKQAIAPAKTPEAPREVQSPPTPKWVVAVEHSNRWRSIEPAPGDVVLGVSSLLLRTSEGRQRATGFYPHKGVLAPRSAFHIQEHEVTWSELERFLQAEKRQGPKRPRWVPDEPAARADLPATDVPWELASAFCGALGGALPSEAEWEWTARSGEPSLRTYPWGEGLPFASRVRIRIGDGLPLAEVTTNDQDVTPDRVYDLLGNAREWTRDRWTSKRLGGVAPQGPALYRAVRGWPLGASGAALPFEGASLRARSCATESCVGPGLDLVGFRCVRH